MTRIFFVFIALFISSISLSAQDTYRVKADKLRVRATSDPKSKVISNISQNQNIIVLDASNPKFYKIKLKNGEGWVSKDFVEKIASSKPAAQQPNAPQPNTAPTSPAADIIYRVTTDNLRVRAKADSKSKVIGYLPENENVAVIDSTNSTFFKIKVTNGEGWVSREFLVRVSPVKPAASTNAVPAASVPQAATDYTNIIFFAVVALILAAILFFSLKYASGNKLIIGFSVVIILVTGYFCFITFIQEKTVAGTFASNEDIQYKTFTFKSKDSVTVTDAYTDSTFTSKYVIDGEMIKLYDQQNTIMLLIRDENTLIGEGFTRGTFTKK
ncbi:SH3 domain-containing protein [Pedobacter frigidisoli]|uniref:SH3 domain-containing protein n=1 Tax=Pedobacter frigidisoli TaxID=2530455 RepID=A0A4R0NT37_9SPHI|nr:SH3 domain-containing protein [Pedobacter frigidisoli]TCD04382.1 SH3 domain-containing protein [Pedobacter frigidisoli]